MISKKCTLGPTVFHESGRFYGNIRENLTGKFEEPRVPYNDPVLERAANKLKYKLNKSEIGYHILFVILIDAPLLVIVYTKQSGDRF